MEHEVVGGRSASNKLTKSVIGDVMAVANDEGLKMQELIALVDLEYGVVG